MTATAGAHRDMTQSPSAPAILEVRGLTAGYGGAPVLHQVDLTVETGSITAVLGANGAGKTTLLRALSGLVKVTEGEVLLDGQNLRGVPVEQLVHRGMAHVPEGRGVVVELTVEENLRLGGLFRRDNADVARAIDEVYQLFEPLARRRTYEGHQLSGGERQMLALGRALVGRPRLLLLDEPSLGLGPRVTAQIMALLRQLRDRPAGGAERSQRAVRGRPGHGHVAGPGRGQRARRQAPRRREPSPHLSGLLAVYGQHPVKPSTNFHMIRSVYSNERSTE
jgi:branched-chain amino acid transport system ATP-binding protein